MHCFHDIVRYGCQVFYLCWRQWAATAGSVVRFVLAGVMPLVVAGLVQGGNLPENFAELPDDVQAVLLEYLLFPEEAAEVWGADLESSSRHVMVKYLDGYHTRVKIDFRAGLVSVDTRGGDDPAAALKHAIAATLLTPANPEAVDLSTAADFGLTGKPFLLGQVLDQDGQPIEYQWRANRFANYLIHNHMRKKGAGYGVNIRMVKAHKTISARGYGQFVSSSSQRYGIAPELILAVMDTESSFNPFAVSPVGALGLMQVMSKTAGKDVYQKIYRRSDRPSKKVLFDPKSNIDIGTAYLSVLRDAYLKGIHDRVKQEYCIIAAYNGGAGNLLKTFHRDRNKALAKINAMSPQQVYKKILTSHPKLESRNYLKKVVAAKRKFAGQ